MMIGQEDMDRDYPPLSNGGAKVAPLIDHTLLKPDATLAAIAKICEEASFYDFATVCVNPVMVTSAVDALAGSKTGVCATIGFPLGASTTDTKRVEAEAAVVAGADELDMVLCISALKDQNYRLVANDIAAVVTAGQGRIVKVILETCLLTDAEKREACRIARDSGAGFVKTSTGFAGGGATCEDVVLMREAVGSDMGVKASGGIKTLDQAIAMINAGAARIGTSAGVAIVT